jgi:hypothetical protein
MLKHLLKRWFLIPPLLLIVVATPLLFLRPHSGAQASQNAVTGTHHYFYDFPNGYMNVYDMDNNFSLVQSVQIPTVNVRGVVFDPHSGMLYISDGGNGGIDGNGSLIKYNLVTQQVVYNVAYSFGVDSLAITPDGKTIYLPDGSLSPDGTWHIINPANGQVTGTILTISGLEPHDTDMSANGQYVYMEGVDNPYIWVANTATNQIVQKVGPFQGYARPFVVNQSGTLVYTTENGLIGFGVGNLQTGQVLYNVSAPGFSLPAGFNSQYVTPSHGISLSPDGKTVYVVDMPNSYVHVFNVSGLPGTAPTMTASIPISPITGTESPCKFDCTKEGWLEQSLDGRYLFVGNSGSIIDTTTNKVVANLATLADTRMFLEVDWVNGVPVNSEDRTDFYWNGGAAPTPPPNTPPGPVNRNWYLAEGRVGKGFREYLTLENPAATPCAVNIQYNYTPDGGSPANKTVAVTVNPYSRLTESVNNDLGFVDLGGSAATVATVVTVNSTATGNCNGVVVERPMYFVGFHGQISSGTDVLGSTTLSNTYYFADVPSGANYTSYLTILNPNNTSANVTVNYFAGGKQVGTQSTTVPPNARGTIAPGAISLPAHVTAIVTSNQQIMVERPTYFMGIVTNGTPVSGAYDIVGVPALSNDWLFAEGYTGSSTQEYLTIANPTSTAATASITLESRTGATNTYTVPVGADSQVIWNVNANNTFFGSTPEVSAEVKSTGSNIIVQREEYFTYNHTLQNGRNTTAMGGTDVIGQKGPAAYSSYSFAEGYANVGYNEWLTIQNPTANQETITVTLVNGLGQSSVQTYQVAAHSRFTQDIANLIQQVFNPGTNSQANSVSMTVQTLNNGGVFVAERPMYYNTNGVSPFAVQGGTDIVGYIGG